MTDNEYRIWSGIGLIKMANEECGQKWFSPATLKFFGCRVSSTIYGGRFFITSELGPSGRKYSIRQADKDGCIDTVGEYGGYDTRQKAISALRDIIKGND